MKTGKAAPDVSVFDFYRFLLQSKTGRPLLWLLVEVSISCVGIAFSLYIGRMMDLLADGGMSVRAIVLFIVLLLGSELIFYFIKVAVQVDAQKTLSLATNGARQRMLDHLLRQRRPFYRKFKEGEILSRLTSEFREAMSQLTMLSVYMLKGFVMVLIILIILAVKFNISLALLAFGIALVFALPLNAMSRKSSSFFGEVIRRESGYSNQLLESVENIKELRAYGAKDAFTRQQQAATQELCQMKNRQELYTAPVPALAEVSTYVILLAALLVAGRHAKAWALGPGDYYVIYHFVFRLFIPLRDIGSVPGYLRNFRLVGRRFAELYHSNDGLERSEEIIEQPVAWTLQNYTFFYPEATCPALRAVDFTVREGDFVCLVGGIGSGKTTLLEQPLLLDPLGEGAFFLDGRDVSEAGATATDGQIAYVPQEAALFAGTIADNLRLGCPSATKEDMLVALKLAAFEFPETMPEGLDTLVGERGLTLSGGQKKRIVLARAYLSDAKLWLLDDIFSAVDAETEQKMLGGLSQGRKGRTVVLATHRMSATRLADRIDVLQKGSVIASGTYDELLASCPEFQRLVDAEAKEVDHA